MRLSTLLIAVLVLVLVAPARGTHYVVDHTGNGNFETIQEGINATTHGDTVLVAKGTYAGEFNKDLDFLSRRIVVRSISGADSTIIDCGNAGRGFNFQYGEDETAVVDGFTITNGDPTTGGGAGAGIKTWNSTPTIRNCKFISNATDYGGGMYVRNSTSPVSSGPAITDCTFTGNQALGGGGIFCWGCSPTITGCTFFGNTATAFPGAGVGCGYDSSPAISQCTFSENNGAGVHADASDPTITNTIIAFSNTTTRTNGKAIVCGSGAEPTITYCCIFGNEGGDDLCGSYSDNIFLDPLLCNDYLELCENSPCAQGSPQNPSALRIGAQDPNCPPCGSAVEHSSWGRIKMMYR